MATDEYGCEIPEHHRSWTEKAADSVGETDGWSVAADVILGPLLGPIGLLFGGHVLDELPGVGGPLAGPFNEIYHASREAADWEKHNACVAEAKANLPPDVPAPPTYDPESGGYVDESGQPVSYEGPHDGQY